MRGGGRDGELAAVKVKGRLIKEGQARAAALVSKEAIGFFGGVDPETSVVVEPGHELEGQAIAGTVLVFPRGKGSTVGSYTLYRLSKKGLGPSGIINSESEAIVAVGAIIADIAMVDHVNISQIRTGDMVTIDGETVEITRRDTQA
jgi:predicted aconitase with swiveling domain